MAQSGIRPHEELHEMLPFERLLAEISTFFINLPAIQIDKEIDAVQRRICELLDLDRSTLWLSSGDDPEMLWLTHVHQPPEIPSPPGRMSAKDFWPWTVQKILGGETLAISKISELPAEAARDRESYRLYGTKSTVVVPLSAGKGKVFGSLAFAVTRDERDWQKKVVQQFQLVAQIFANALSRKRMEEMLRESEKRLSLATASAETGIWIMNLETGFVWVTDKLRELFRFAPDEELNFERFLEVIHPKDREIVRESVRQSLEQRESLSVEYRILHPDGSIRWVVSRGRPDTEAPGQPERLMGVSTDVTQRKMTELQLRESRTLLSALIDSTSDMIWSVDSEHFGLLTFNRGHYEYFLNQRGIHIEAGMRPEDLFPTEEYAEKWCIFYRRALEEGSFTLEYRVYAGTRTLRLNLNRLMRDDIVFGVSVFGQDITERKRAEEAVRESEAKYRSLYESMMDGYVLVGMDGRILKYNESYRNMTGYAQDELLRLTSRDITPDKWHAVENEIIEKQVLVRGYSQVYEKEYRKKDGTVFPIELRAFLLKHETGSNIGLWAIVRDITDRKLIESEARKLREDLAHVTRVSTLGELTSSLAHEINQPLAAILSNAQAAQRFLSQDKPDMKEVAEILGDIVRDDNRAAEVIRKIRSLLKKEEARYETLSLNDVIEEILNVVHNDTALTAVSIEKELDPSLPSIWGDRIQLQQVILNLVLNAAEAMKEAETDVRRLNVRTSKKNGHFAKVSIRDRGPGIEKNNANRLFEPFYTTKTGGMGMGLAISKDIVKSHKGEIWAENNPDRGTTFSFTVPFDGGVRT
jgi:two-component system sensor kinase FixL